jgi:hypothetical protein
MRLISGVTSARSRLRGKGLIYIEPDLRGKTILPNRFHIEKVALTMHSVFVLE